MEERRIHIDTHVTEEERDIIREKAGKAGLTCSRFIRLAALGAEIREPPCRDVPVLINEVRKVGTALDLILQEMRQDIPVSAETMEKAIEDSMHTEELIREAYGNRWR